MQEKVILYYVSLIVMKKARVLALYLPQFHPIPENDKWWGKGFTEWTNVGKAKPLFKGHYQPRIPADLGYYDLRLPEVRKAQADMARENGIEGFVYWHYWFGNGKRLIERPFDEVLQTGDPDFPFALAWANETWKGFDHGLKNRNILIEQQYPGAQDYINHFYTILPAFQDKRYIKITDKPIFMIYKPLANIKEIQLMISIWRELALANNLNGIHFIAHCNDPKYNLEEIRKLDYDSINIVRLYNYVANHRSLYEKCVSRIRNLVFGKGIRLDYEKAANFFLNSEEDMQENIFPSVIPCWDHSPRSGKEGLILTNSTPLKFANHLKEALELVANKPDDKKIIFLKSWNEWAEGNYVEPDIIFGHGYLDAIRTNIY